MLTKWFGTNHPVRPKATDSFGRNWNISKAVWRRQCGSNGFARQRQRNGHGNGNGGGPPGHSNVHNMNNTHYNIHITGSVCNGNVELVQQRRGGGRRGEAVGPGQVEGADEERCFNLSGLVAAETSEALQLGMLIDDEIAVAVDTYPSSTLGLNITGLDNAMTILNTDIHNNPLESTLVGQVVGSLAFDVIMDALTMAQPTI